VNRLGSWLLTTAMAVQQYSCHYSSKHSFAGSVGNAAPDGDGSHMHPVGLIIVAFGLLLLYGAYQNYRKLRALEKLPIMPIGEVAPGNVHITGKAVGAPVLTSPLTRRPCFYYRVLVESWAQSGNRSQNWSMCMRHIDHTNFYLQDGTGSVAVDLQGAQLDLTQVFQRAIEPGREPASIGGTGPSGNDLRDYLALTNAKIHADLAERQESVIRALAQAEGSVSLLPASFSPRDSGLRLRFTETCLLVDQECNVLGTCLDNPSPRDGHDRRLIARGQKQDIFSISCNAEAALEQQIKRGFYVTLAVGIALTALGICVTTMGEISR